MAIFLFWFSVLPKTCGTLRKSPVISDHYAIILKSEVEHVSKNSGCCFSSSSFDPELLRKFLPLTRTFACRIYEISADFIPECYRLLDFAIEKSVSKKRRKRREIPFYYSSTTMHRWNKLSTERKQHNFSKVRDLENELANWIEIDKHFLLAKTCNFSTNEAFALLRKLNGRNCIPTKVFIRNESASDNLEKANLFNTFFSSVYHPSSEMDLNSFVFQDVVCLSEVNLSVKEIQSQLLKIADCSTVACDGVPPTIYNSSGHFGSFCLPYVYSC